MAGSRLILVHGLFRAADSNFSGDICSIGAARSEAVARHGERLGIQHYEWVDAVHKAMANRFLRFARGTAQPVDALEIMEIDEAVALRALATDAGRDGWREIASCTPFGLDAGRSFILAGSLRELVRGPALGQRVFWLGRGLGQLSEAEFITHYTGHHGPLVAANATCLGIRRYRQVASEPCSLCDSLRDLDLGQASPPPVFAELAMGTPPLNPKSLLARRAATAAIKKDEKRHIDFARSMLLLT